MGGAGDDVYVVDSTNQYILERANEGVDTVKSSVTFSLVAGARTGGGSVSDSLENLTLTGTNAIDGTGNALGNVLTGNAAANLLLGNAGNDTLIGGGGNDTLNGGTGNDTLRATADGATGAALDTVLDELAACGWQSDARFAQMWIQAHAARHGAQRLRQDLRQRGVATADIDAALAEHQAAEPEQDELSRARAAWARKFAALPTNREDYARQYRFLASRGFASGIVSKVLSGRDRD